MNPISSFFVEHIIYVFFFYGLAFYTLGVTLVMVGRQSSQLRFARAIWPLALFGFLHGAHEWFEMFQLVHLLETGQPPGRPTRSSAWCCSWRRLRRCWPSARRCWRPKT